MLKKLGALAVAASMFVASTAFAATPANQGALAPGKPATVKAAQRFDDRAGLLWLLGGGVVIGGIVLVLTSNGHGTPTSTTTSCTTP